MISKLVQDLRNANRLVVGGMFFFISPGHMLSEADYLLRCLRRYPWLRDRNPLVIFPPTDMTQVIGEMLKHHGIQVIFDPNGISILREIQLFHPDITFDAGMAHWKVVVPDTKDRSCGDLYPLTFGWALRRDEFIAQIIRMHEAWNATHGQNPLRESLNRMPMDPGLARILVGRKYAVFQTKVVTGNGTASLLGGQIYRPTLDFLRDNGYSLVMGGREPLPEEFKGYDFFDYPRSKYVSPRNDFHLFANAGLGIVSPSGAGMFCDTMGTPCCQVGSWTLIPHPGERTLMVPSRVRERATGKIKTFAQQSVSLRDTYDPVLGPAVFDSKTLEDIQPSAEDVLAGVQESIHRERLETKEACELRQRLRDLDPLGMWRTTRSQLSPAFLTSHPEFIA